MAKDIGPSTSDARPSTLRRALPYLLLAGAVAAFLFHFFSDSASIQRHINALHSDNPKTRKEQLGYLRSHPDKKLVNELLLENVKDTGKAWSVRRMCAFELERRERLPDLQRLLRDGERTSRCVAMDVLANRPYFQNTWAPDPSYRVYETLTEWIQDENDVERARAVQIAKILDWRDGLEFIRPLLRRSGRGNISAKQERMILEAASSAVQRFNDCESVPALMALASDDPSGHVRMRAMQEVHRMVFERDNCPGAASEDDMKSLVVARLNDDEQNVRMAAMIIYKFQLAWAGDSVETLRTYLAEAGRKNAERRLALEVLIAVDDPAFLKELPRWFHDSAPEVRSSAAQAVRKYVPAAENPFLGSLIGVLRNETQNKSAFDAAADQLRAAAGTWRGVPAAMAANARSGEGRRQFQQVLNGLFSAGEAQGVQRGAFATDWFRWYAERQGLQGKDVDEALAVYEKFWTAADRDDVAGAKAALESSGAAFGKPKLFEDLAGWLRAQ